VILGSGASPFWSADSCSVPADPATVIDSRAATGPEAGARRFRGAIAQRRPAPTVPEREMKEEDGGLDRSGGVFDSLYGAADSAVVVWSRCVSALYDSGGSGAACESAAESAGDVDIRK